MQNLYRSIKHKLDKDTLIVDNEFGYRVTYKIISQSFVDPVTIHDDKIPDFFSQVQLEFVKIEKLDDAKPQKHIEEELKKRSILDPSLQYDHILLGYVYADATDPNNHRWWLDVRDKQDNNISNLYCDEIEIRCPFTTKAWHDGIWHGRFVFNPAQLESIKQPKPGKLVLQGKLKTQCRPIDPNKTCSLPQVPNGTKSIRLRYNIFEDLWIADFLDNKDEAIGNIPVKSIMCDVTTYGQVLKIGDKPKVSIRMSINDISEIAIAVNSLIIRGK